MKLAIPFFMNRLQKIGVACCLLAGAGSFACASPSTPEPRGGEYQGEHMAYRTCLFADPNATQLMPNLACDLANQSEPHSYQILGDEDAGTDQDGNPCGFDFAHDQPVPLNGNTFEIDTVSPGGADGVLVNGTLSGDSATGTSSKLTPTSRCDIDWTADHVNGGTGGVGGDGGSSGVGGGGTGGSGGEDPVTGLDEIPDCTAGEPHDFADGTFGSGWVDDYLQRVPESTFATRQGQEGGNPDRYHSVDLSTGASTVGTSTCVRSLHDGATYDPAEHGAYTNFTARLQAKPLGSEHSSLQTRFSVLVQQGDDAYWGGPESIMIKFADGWTDQQLSESQLHLWPSYDNPQAPDPDGEAIRFGFVTCVNGEREDSAVDNFIVRVCDGATE